MEPVKWLLVGAGDIARKRVAPALAAAQDSEITAVCDVRQELAGRLAAEYQAQRSFTDYAEALQHANANAVYLATPVHLHAPFAEKALESGMHVLVEKPLSLTAGQSHRLVQLARQSGKTAACAYFRRFYPAYLKAKQMLEAGEFGQVVHVRMIYYSWFGLEKDDPKYWRVERAKSGGGPLSDMGSHMLDLLIGLFGLPEKVFAWCENLIHSDWDVEDSASLMLKLRSGAQAAGTFSWCSQTWRHEFEIVGSKAKVSWLPFDSGEVVCTVGRQVESLVLPPAKNVHQPLVDDFIQAIREGRQPACSFSEAAKTDLLLDAIYRSSAESSQVAL
jgi:predicted dehydrogenase